MRSPSWAFEGSQTSQNDVCATRLLASSQTVAVTLEYPLVATGNGPTPAPLDPVAAQDGKHSPATVQSPLAPVTVPPYSTQDISLAAAMSQFPSALPFGSVRIQYSGPPGSLQAEVTSVESMGNLVIDSRIQNEGNGWAGSGANPWHLDDDTESILFLTNECDQPAHFGFKVTANGSAPYYLTKLLLKPHETRAIDIRKLRDAQQADFKGNLIPADATDGSVMWIRGDNLPVMGRLMQIHRRQGMASNYDCCVCVCPYNYTPSINLMSPTSLYLLVNSQGSIAFEAGYEDCNSFEYWYDYTTSASWSSVNPSIASIQGLGMVKGVSGGTAGISASYSGYSYTFNGSYCNPTPRNGGGNGPANVTAPYAAVVINTQVQGAANCGSGAAGWSRTVTMQLQNQIGSPIPIGGILMADVISVSTPNPLGVGSANGGSHSTDSSGTWPDTYYVCSSACPGSTGEADPIQTWTWSGAPLPHSNFVVYKCNSITSDGR